MHHDRVSLIRSAKATSLWEHGNGAGGARLGVNANNVYFTIFSLSVKLECKSFDATFWVSTIVHPYAMERVAATPNKVHPPTLQAILHLACLCWF
jgi:hypothetical protein